HPRGNPRGRPAPDDLLGPPQRPVERALLQQPRPVARQVVARELALPDLQVRSREARQLELAVVGVARPRVPGPAHGHARAAGGPEDLALDRAPDPRRGRSPVEAPAQPNLLAP